MPQAGAQQESDFFTLTPCRVYDSRWGEGPLAGGFGRGIPIGGYCGIPPDASAALFNLTVISPTGPGLLSAYPCCAAVQNIVQGVQAGRTLAGSAVLRLGEGGRIGAFIGADYSTTAHLAADVAGYFRPTAPIQQWREWEETLLSPADYTLHGGDPYSEVELDVRFTHAAAGLSFVQPAFWDGDELSPRIFKVRTAVPAGNWAWRIESCTRNGVSCLPGWAPNQGSFFVQSNTASGNPLYDRGFVQQVATVVAGQVVAFSPLEFPDGSKFTWVGDTAWAAPPREIDGQTNAWAAYLADRKSKGFTAVQIAPAVAWQAEGAGWRSLPAAKGLSFTMKKSGCEATPIPNTDCWRRNRAYWDHFKKMVEDANDAEMLVALVGVMNPTGISTTAAYPDAKGARAFVRFLVGLLGSQDVIYSPAFDDDADEIDPGSAQPRSLLMNAVGNELKRYRNPKGERPLTNHLAGGKGNCDEYAAFASNGWMTHHLFQSGHGSAGDTTGPCAPSGSNTDIQNAMMRARVMPLTLGTYAPRLPAINAEGPYDATNFNASVPHPNVDTRYRVRQAGYLSALSNAVGFSYGAHGLSVWDQPGGNFPGEPATYFGLASADDMTRLKANLEGRGLLVSHPEWILNNPADQKYKMVLGSNETSFVMAYLPGDQGDQGGSSPTIKIDATNLPCLVCPSPQNGSPWSFTWVNPVTDITTTASSCSGAVGGQITVTRPECASATNPSCDWLLKIEKTGACPSTQTASATSSSLEAWGDTSLGDGTSAIHAAHQGPAGSQETVLLSPAGKAFQVAPRVSRVAGYDLVVWQADGLDGSLYGIYGSLVGPRGEVVGPFKINHYTEHDQREPAAAGGVRGEALVVWSSYDQDGDRGGIFGRFVKARVHGDDLPRENLGEEIEIAEVREGHQQRPLVVADSGGYWVAWETVGGNGLSRGLSVRRLGMDGRPVSAEIPLPAEAGEQRKLLALDSPTPSSVAVRWWRQEARGAILEPLGQVVGPHGALGPVTPGRN